MSFQIEFTPDAVDDVRSFRKHEQRQIIEAVERQLAHLPIEETRNRKKLRPNELAEWELRIGKFRVFYDVDTGAKRVKIEAVGWKKGSRLFIRKREYEL